MLRPERRRTEPVADHPTRTRLVDTTVEQMRTLGLDAVDVDAVLKEVGVTKGSLYHHFGSVNDLIIAALLKIFASGLEDTINWYRSMQDNCTSADDLREEIHRIVKWSQSQERHWARAEHARILSIASSNPDLQAKIAEVQKRLTDEITEVLTYFQSRSWLRTDIDARAFAVFTQAFTVGRIIDDVVDPDDRVNADAWTNLVLAMADDFYVFTSPKSQTGNKKRKG